MYYSWNRLASSAVDIAIAPFIPVLAAIASRIVDRRKYPHCGSLLDQAGIAFVKHHYYTPVVFPSDIDSPLCQDRAIAGLNFNETQQISLLNAFSYHDELLMIPLESTNRLEYFYNNGSFEVGDGEYLYNMIRHFKPRRIVEIGCGFSTLMARRAIARNREESEAYECSHICIEPFEQPWLETLDLQVLRTKVEKAPASIFKSLRSGDILFIDSSHVIRPQGDVLFEYLELLGCLAPGVIVHVHDIFTPRNYPEAWVLTERRMWNEQYLLEAFLCFNPAFEVIGAVNWLSHKHRDNLEKACPQLFRNPTAEPGSFWFRRVA